MLTYPAKYMLPQQCRLRSIDVTQTADSQGGIDNTNRIGYKHKWAIDITTPKLKYSDVMALFSFACQLGGKYSPCLVPNPYPSIGSSALLTHSRETTQQGAQSVALYNLPSAKKDLLLPGDFIQFVDHSKVYMVTLPLNSNGAGQGTVSFTPPLRKNVSQHVSLRVGDRVFFTMRLNSDKQDIQLRADQGKESAVKIQFEEYIND